MAWGNKTWKNYIPENSSANLAIARWHAQQPDRVQTTATPSTLTDCPRVVWLKYKHHVPITNVMGWGKKQRLLLGRNFENQIAEQYKAAGQLLFHWKDDVPGESIKFGMGEGDSRIEGTPDLLLKLDAGVAISDAKTSRADSFAYVPLEAKDIWKDAFWYKYKLQVTAYYMLAHKNKEWFVKNGKREELDFDELQYMDEDEANIRPLPLPDICHLFSFALDDGIVRREITWKPSQKDAAEVIYYAKRWNRAYRSETMPDCVCSDGEGKGVIFCAYGIMEPGKNVCSTCCDDKLIEQVKE